MIVYSINVAGKTGLPLAKNKLDSFLHHSQKLSQNELKT